ncbi:MAG: hypothetical protein U9P50_03575 [Patescibacteria group bacterium]|nr:hypothetical protein [Patescibacteria group bacterium]
MKKIVVFGMMVAFCLVFTSITFADPPKKDRCQWVSASAVSVNTYSGKAMYPKESDEEITTPEVWFGGWGEEEKYFLGFYAEGIKPEYQVIYGIKGPASFGDWGYVSLTNPQDTQILHNSGEYETYSFPYVQTGVYVPGPGEYSLEMRIYITSEWYFRYTKVVTVPAFEVWLSDVCTEDSQVKLSFTLYSYFSTKFAVGDKITMNIDRTSLEVFVSSINEWGNAQISVMVDPDTYGNYQGESFLVTFILLSGESYSQDIYFWEPYGECSSSTKG